jgi:hypothetical protein
VTGVPSEAELRQAHEVFLSREKRSVDFDVAARLLEQALAGSHNLNPPVPVALLLQSWNFAYYQSDRRFDVGHFKAIDTVVSVNRKALDSYRGRHIRDLVDGDRHGVEPVFGELLRVVGRIGAAKVLHLWAPEFFPLWDNPIAKAYGFDLSEPAAQYWAFMIVVRGQVAAVRSTVGLSSLKLIDEYNYCRYTKGWV